MAALSSTLAASALTAQATGVGISTIGAYGSARGQQASLLAQADIADTNARIAELGAQSELAQGQRQVGALTLKAGALKSGQRVALAANGVDMGVGNAAELQASTDLMKEIDVNTATSNAVNAAWGRRVQATNLRNEARSARATAGSISPLMAGATTLLGGAASVAQSWYGLTKAGALDEFNANLSLDPIKSMGEARGWWS